MPSEIRVPTFGESVVEAVVGRWLKQQGDAVAVGEPVVELETEKVNTEVAADEAGVLSAVLRKEGETVQPGDVLGIVEAGAQSTAAKPAAQTEPHVAAEAQLAADSNHAANAVGKLRASPVAIRLAQDLDVDLARVTPSGPGGRITKEDVERFSLGQRDQGMVASPLPAPPAAAAPSEVSSTPSMPTLAKTPFVGEGSRPETRERMSRRRLTIARRLVEAQHTAAMLTTFNEIDMSAVLDLRRRRREDFRRITGVDLGFMSFFVKGAVGALKAFPQVNSELQGEELVIKYYYDIGIAIGVEEGLVVPVVRDVDRLSFAAIERAIAEFAQRAREGTLTLDELRGGTFTISNGGVFGSLFSTPILNPPQVGILGMHKTAERAVVVGGQVVVRPMMYVALTYDHRVIDGRQAVLFLVRLKELIEDPERLLLES